MQWFGAVTVLICTLQAVAAIQMDDAPYEVGDTTFKGTLVYDDASGGIKPGIVVFPEWWGANDYIKGRARMLAEAGYVAFAADMYGDGKVSEDPKEAGSLAQGVIGRPQVMIERARAAVARLRASGKADPGRVAAIGYCMGGSIALNLAYAGDDLKTVVAFHAGPARRVPEMGQIKASILLMNGGADKMVSPQETQDFVAAMEAAKANWELVLFGAAMHAYTNPNADKYKDLGTLGYNAQADKRSWQYMLIHLDQALDYKRNPAQGMGTAP